MWTWEQANAEVNYRVERRTADAEANRQVKAARHARDEAKAAASAVASRREPAVRKAHAVRA